MSKTVMLVVLAALVAFTTAINPGFIGGIKVKLECYFLYNLLLKLISKFI